MGDEECTAWLAEEEDLEDVGGTWLGEPDRWLTGRFRCFVQQPSGLVEETSGLGLEAALEWAAARADRVVVRLADGDEPREAGPRTEGLARWPPPGLELPLRRRRPEDERWKDRVPGDPPIAWAVEVLLEPDDAVNALFDERERIDREVQGIAGRVTAEVDVTSVDAFVADLRRQEHQGWWTLGNSPGWQLRLVVEAATREQAAAQALARIGEVDGWTVEAAARPA